MKGMLLFFHLYGYMASDIWHRTTVTREKHCCHMFDCCLCLALQGIFYMLQPTDRKLHNMAFVLPVVEYWLQQEIIEWDHQVGSIWWPITPWVDALPHSYKIIQNCLVICKLYAAVFDVILIKIFCVVFLEAIDIAHLSSQNSSPFHEGITSLKSLISTICDICMCDLYLFFSFS